MFVDAPELPKVRKLARPRDVTNGGEERVLNDGPQQHVRAEPLGVIDCFGGERREGVRAVTHDKLIGLTTDRTT